MMKSGDEASPESRNESRRDERAESASYHYATADIREREGSVPLWLKLVIIGLLIWAVYYMVTFWSPPA